MRSIYDLAANYDVGGLGLRAPGGEAEQMPAMEMPAVNAVPASLAVPTSAPASAPASAAVPAGMLSNPMLSDMLSRYFPAGNEYESELRTAREAASKEAAAFQDMIKRAMSPEKESGPSKAEMYFRLAAAFGAPTRTGNFVESLGKAGEVTSEILKEKRTAEREAKQRNLQLGIEAQKLKMQSAKDDLTTLRQLAAEGMKDKRTIATELIKDYVKSGQPQSTAGKQAQDEGLQPGTPEFQKRVSQIAEMNIEKQMAQINAALSGMSAAQANLALAQQKFQFQQGQAAKLTPAEVKLKNESETTLGALDDSMSSLKRAYALNPNTFEGTWLDIGRQKVLEQTAPKDPRVLATREQKNLLGKGAIEKLKASFGGNPTEGERAALLELEGLDSKSKEERALIMKNTYKLLQARRAREQKRLNEIAQGLYRETTPSSGDLE